MGRRGQLLRGRTRFLAIVHTKNEMFCTNPNQAVQWSEGEILGSFRELTYTSVNVQNITKQWTDCFTFVVVESSIFWFALGECKQAIRPDHILKIRGLSDI